MVSLRKPSKIIHFKTLGAITFHNRKKYKFYAPIKFFLLITKKLTPEDINRRKKKKIEELIVLGFMTTYLAKMNRVEICKDIIL